MRISKEQLQKIVAEEVQAHFKKSLMSESKSESRTIKATPAMLKRIINEEVLKLSEMHEGFKLLVVISGDKKYVEHNGKEVGSLSDLNKLRIQHKCKEYDVGFCYETNGERSAAQPYENYRQV